MVLGFAGVKKVNYYGACQEACNTIREVGNIYNYNIEHNIVYSRQTGSGKRLEAERLGQKIR